MEIARLGIQLFCKHNNCKRIPRGSKKVERILRIFPPCDYFFGGLIRWVHGEIDDGATGLVAVPYFAETTRIISSSVSPLVAELVVGHQHSVECPVVEREENLLNRLRRA